MPAKIKIATYTNSDDAFVVWVPDAVIPDCLGFALERARTKNGKEIVEVLDNRVGFAADSPKEGEHRPSTEWPFQRFDWTDHLVNDGDRVRYRATPMLLDATTGKLKPGTPSPWSKWADLTPAAGKGFACYFNRGLVISQFMARYLKRRKLTLAAFKKELKKHDTPIRDFLMGDLGAGLFALLAGAKKDARKVHAALYELDDADLIDSLVALKKDARVVLANGSWSDKMVAGKKVPVPDQNAAERAALKAGGVDVSDRLLKRGLLGHNKFLAITDAAEKPLAVWTGSTNWTTTGLCTQVNNGLLITDAAVAQLYLDQWKRLKAAGNDFPPALVAANDLPKSAKVGTTPVKVQFTRTSAGQDTAALKKLIADAKEGILFLMFTPGGKGLDFDIAARLGDPKFFVQGVVSDIDQKNGGLNFLEVGLVADGAPKKQRFTEIVQPQGIAGGFASWAAEVSRRQFKSQVGHAIVHSKVIVIDPFGADPVVITGSHNMSGNASAKNDENFVVIRSHAALARAYAVNIVSVYQHYRWRAFLRDMLAKGKKPFSHLNPKPDWLPRALKNKAKDLAFWL